MSTAGADAGELEGVLDVAESSALGKTGGPTLDGVGVERLTTAAASADDVVTMPRAGSLPIQPLPRLIPHGVQVPGPLQVAQRAVDRGQTHRERSAATSRAYRSLAERKPVQSASVSRTAARCRVRRGPIPSVSASPHRTPSTDSPQTEASNPK